MYLDTPTDSALHLSATMASADFCIFSIAFRLWLPFSERSMQTSPGTTRFFPSVYLPHLPPLVPCSYGTSTCSAALSPTIASYAVPVRQARGLPPTSFRFRLTTNTLVFGYVFPATGQTPVFHRLETCAAGRTPKGKDCCKYMRQPFLMLWLHSIGSSMIYPHFYPHTNQIILDSVDKSIFCPQIPQRHQSPIFNISRMSEAEGAIEPPRPEELFTCFTTA